ncbi:MAG: hypothetical protein FH748_13760 [Balneolaceae bacterium]|nr:hypothetical protein [Balneolaceae bacterium]
MKERSKKRLANSFIFVAAIFVGVILNEVYIDFKEPFDKSYGYAIADSTYLVSVYLGCSTCVYSNTEEVISSSKTIIDKVKSITDSLGISYLSIGVSRDKNLNEGINHLLKVNKFNEISTGNDWHSVLLNHYIWDKGLVSSATPQLFFIKRRYSVDTTGSRRSIGKISDEEVISVLYGSEGIENGINSVDRIIEKFQSY